jgi:hypothetical protein
MNVRPDRTTKYTKSGLSGKTNAIKRRIVQVQEGETIDFTTISKRKMSVRKLKPITPGQRFRVVNGYDAITTDKPERSLIAPIKNSGGRNSQGKMTMRYTGGGHKQRYRIIDFKRTKEGIPATVKSIEYDPNRTVYR